MSVRKIQIWLGSLLLCLAPSVVQADGGVVRLREAQGPFVITVFTPSELVSGVDTDVSVLVQGRDSGDAILDASIDLVFTLANATGPVIEPIDPLCSQPAAASLRSTSGSQNREVAVPATHKQASNKLLYAALIKFPVAGGWGLRASVQRGHDAAEVACGIPIGMAPRRLPALIPFLGLPLLLVALFGMNQWLRRDSLEKQ